MDAIGVADFDRCRIGHHCIVSGSACVEVQSTDTTDTDLGHATGSSVGKAGRTDEG
jgi:hypothetical protein